LRDRLFLGGDAAIPLERVADRSSLVLHCIGGIRAADLGEDRWVIEPILAHDVACACGYYTKQKLHQFCVEYGFKALGFQHIHWTDGAYYSSWSPINPTKRNHLLGPADLWGNISSNLEKDAIARKLPKSAPVTRELIAAALDSRGTESRLAYSISLSLSGMDIAVESLSDYYYESLVDLMAMGRLGDRRIAFSRSQNVYPHVHSFFVHFGASRDYLAALVGTILGLSPKKTDSLARLVECIRPEHFSASPILELMRSRGLLVVNEHKPARWKIAGWLHEATEARNRFVHRAPYGLKALEHMSYADAVRQEDGIFRYVRPVVHDSGASGDILDLITNYYQSAVVFFDEAARLSGFDFSMATFTDDDIISIEPHRGI
jgi:hypothetical protein